MNNIRYALLLWKRLQCRGPYLDGPNGTLVNKYGQMTMAADDRAILQRLGWLCPSTLNGNKKGPIEFYLNYGKLSVRRKFSEVNLKAAEEFGTTRPGRRTALKQSNQKYVYNRSNYRRTTINWPKLT